MSGFAESPASGSDCSRSCAPQFVKNADLIYHVSGTIRQIGCLTAMQPETRNPASTVFETWPILATTAAFSFVAGLLFY
jgi:hypothetical protein